jgi:hypothetical protein
LRVGDEGEDVGVEVEAASELLEFGAVAAGDALEEAGGLGHGFEGGLEGADLGGAAAVGEAVEVAFGRAGAGARTTAGEAVGLAWHEAISSMMRIRVGRERAKGAVALGYATQ